VDSLLTNVSVAYRNPKYIADSIFPIVPVVKQSGIIPQYPESHWFRDEARLRAPASRSQGGGYAVDTTLKYFCDRYSYRREVDDEIRDNADAPFDMDREASEFATDRLLMRRERAMAAGFFTTGIWGTDKTGVTDFTQWSDYANSQPLVDLTTYRDAMEGAIALEPNTLVVGKQVWVQLKFHPDVVDAVKYTQIGVGSPELVATLTEFDPSRLLIGRSLYTTSPEGTAEASVTYTRIWGKNVLLAYVAERPALYTVSAGYTFTWARVANSIQYIKRMRDEEREIDIFEANSYYAQTKIAAAAGYFLSSAVA